MKKKIAILKCEECDFGFEEELPIAMEGRGCPNGHWSLNIVDFKEVDVDEKKTRG